MSDDDVDRQLSHVDARLHDPVADRWDEGTADDSSARLYCTQSPRFGRDARWALQLRAPLQTKHRGKSKKHFSITTASMSREDLTWLREQITAALRRRT